MNWYKQAGLSDQLSKWVKSHGDDGAEAWIRDKEVFVSIGDWADRDIIKQLEKSLGCPVDWDYEVGSPDGEGWGKVL